MEYFPTLLYITFCMLGFTKGIEVEANLLYFSNISNIQYYNRTGSNTRVVFDNLGYGEALECNLCDHKIYWIDLPGMIKRGDPNDPASVETIISSDLHDPHGLAVDWISNNIYFSHSRGEGHGRIEVAKCDGSHRKVLRHNLQSVGVLAVNPITGHLYYGQKLGGIKRINLDGSDTASEGDTFIVSPGLIDISGIAVDHRKNILYWAENTTSSNVIMHLNMTEWSRAYRLHDAKLPPTQINVESNPYEIAIINSTIYWTQLREVNEELTSIVRPGAIYTCTMNGSNDNMHATPLIESHDLSPHDLCFFYDHYEDPVDGCAVNNGGCEVFCFSVPDNAGTRVQCGCPTGILLDKNNQSCSSLFPDNYLVFTQIHNSVTSFEVDRTDIRMMSLDIIDQYIDVLVPINLHGTETVFIAYDQVDHRVYWTEVDPPAIMSAYIINGTDERVLINTSISRPESLAIDHFARNLYWIDSGLDKIEVVRLDSSHTRKVLFDSDLSHPQGLALDPLNANMYWTDLDKDVPRVERARMDGTDRMVLPGVVGDIKQPSNIAVDPLTRLVYWSDTHDDNEKIVKYDGERDSPLGILHLSDVLGLAVHGSYIYWTDRGNSEVPLGRADKNSGHPSEPLLRGLSGLHGLVAVNKSADPGSNGCTHFHVSADQLCLPTGNGSYSLTCTDHFNLDSNNNCRDAPLVAFIATEESIWHVEHNTESSGFESWDQRDEKTLDISGATALDVDIIENKIYWINLNDKRIYRRSINSTESDEVECVVCCCLSAPEHIAVDWYGRNLYWTDSDLGIIEISRLDGSERTIFALIPEELGAPSVIKVDPLRGNLYWAPKLQPIVYQGRMDDLAADSPPGMRFRALWNGSENDSTIVNIALNFSRSTGNSGYLYWAVTTGALTKFYKKNLDDPQDSGAEIDSAPVTTQVYDLEAFGGYIFYYKITFNRHSIVNFDTNNFVFGSPTPFMDIAFMHHSLQPGIHECSVNNKDCGGNSLCLVANGTTGVCSCPTLSVLTQERLDGETIQSCIAVDTFLLIATNKSISYAPVPVDGSSTTSRRLSIGPVGNIQAIAYDPANRSVVWIDNVSDLVQSVAVNGSAQWEYSIPSGINTFSMAYDWFGAHIFVTETTGFQIELLTLNGENVGSLLKLGNNPLSVQKPGELVFDDVNSYLYWTNRSINDGYGEAIHRMSLYNVYENNVQTIDIGPRKIDKLTLDSPFLYWIDRKREGAHKIERITLNSTNFSPNVTEIATLADNVTALAATTINNQPHVFWFNKTDGYIYRHYGSTTERYFMWHAADAVIAILGYTNKQLVEERPCLSTARPCSHLCLRHNTDPHYQCACPPSSQRNSANCSSHMCSALQLPCGDEFDVCYPRSYHCDGIRHCRDGADENNCSCKSINDEFSCFNSSGCFHRDERCDGTTDCEQGEDEEFCCAEPTFGCYVDVGDRHDSYGGSGRQLIYQCLEPMSRCDEIADCVDQSDEIDCPTSMTTDPPRSPRGGILEANILIVIIVTIVVIIVMVVLLVGVCITVRWMHKKKQEYDMNQAMIRANNMSMGGYKSHSPPFRSESQSDYCSEMSGGTHTTQLGNGSNMSPSGDTCFKYRTADPPPPSPDALTEIEDDDISRISQPISEYTVPIPPCPSINYDALSGNMSFSVSQSQFPGTITSHYNAVYNPRFGVNGRNLGGNLPNPLLLQQQNGSAYYHPANHVPRQQHIHPNSGKNMPTSNGTSKYADRNYPPAPHYRQNVYSRKELDSVAQSETESTLSLNIDNSPDVFEENLPRPPPGRPPSPATLCSEYPGAHLMSPETGSTVSDSSDDC